MPGVADEDLIVGVENADDAGVYRISEKQAVITTLDFFPPIVDDAYTFGQIAAANALSDVYAMGGIPRLATNIVCFPRALPIEVLNEIIRGALDKLNEAGVLLAGGHSVEDSEIKYGLSIIGFADPARIVTNSGALPGDALVLTKPLGVGVITSALKAGKMSPEDAVEAIESMKTLNRDASAVMTEVGVNACTDITGYGLLGHAMEMAKGSGVNLVIRSGLVKTFPRAVGLVTEKSVKPRTMKSNREFLAPDVRGIATDEGLDFILYDPQTSGGLLISVEEAKAAVLMEKLRGRGVNPFVVGSVVEKEEGWRIRVE